MKQGLRFFIRLAVLLAVLAWSGQRCLAQYAVNITTEVTVEVQDTPTALKARLSVSSAPSFFFNSDTNAIFIAEGATVNFNFTYDPLPTGWPAGSYIVSDPHRIYLNYLSSPLGSGNSASWTLPHVGVGNEFGGVFGQVTYMRSLGPGKGFESFVLKPLIPFYKTDFKVQTRGEDGVIQDCTYPDDRSYDLNNITADFDFDIYIYTVGPDLAPYNGGYADPINVPAADVEARVKYSAGYLSPWATTDATGHAALSIGQGGTPFALTGNRKADKFYVGGIVAVKPNATGYYIYKKLALDGMTYFDGTLNIHVMDADGHPLKGFVKLWGGPLNPKAGTQHGNQYLTTDEAGDGTRSNRSPCPPTPPR